MADNDEKTVGAVTAGSSEFKTALRIPAKGLESRYTLSALPDGEATEFGEAVHPQGRAFPIRIYTTPINPLHFYTLVLVRPQIHFQEKPLRPLTIMR